MGRVKFEFRSSLLTIIRVFLFIFIFFLGTCDRLPALFSRIIFPSPSALASAFQLAIANPLPAIILIRCAHDFRGFIEVLSLDLLCLNHLLGVEFLPDA